MKPPVQANKFLSFDKFLCVGVGITYRLGCARFVIGKRQFTRMIYEFRKYFFEGRKLAFRLQEIDDGMISK